MTKARGRAKVWYKKSDSLGRKLIQFGVLSAIVIISIQTWGSLAGLIPILVAVYLAIK
jgi:hypothetical protein